MIGQRAAEMSQTLAMASSAALARRDGEVLDRMGADLVKNRDLVTVAFFDAGSRPLAVACSRPELLRADPGLVPHVKTNEEHFMQVRHKVSPIIGEYAEVIAPVVQYADGRGVAAALTGDDAARAKLVGYVQVNLCEAEQVQQLEHIRLISLGCAAVVLLVSLPIVAVLVHGILNPIRQLVGATNRLSGGDMDARVDIRRTDMIGMLARAFNTMVDTIRRQQEDLEAANADLEEKVRTRTAQLETANKRLSSEIAEKEDFLRAVSHDLNAPLRNIAGMATMLLMKNKDKFDEDVVHRLERIQKNVQVETDLISELLELSRIKTRRQKMEMVDVAGLVQDVGDVLGQDLSDKGIGLVVDGVLPVLRCEKARLRQVFQNLIDNAVKYMGDGPVREVHVGCTVRRDEAEFYVRDTGIGIDPDDIDKVFYVFRRGKGAAVQGVSGKGVGLASVKSIVETYNGSIWVESQLGRGSTFKFTVNGQFVLPPSAGVTSPTGEQGRAA
jgi:signal transduction histidine kinase